MPTSTEQAGLNRDEPDEPPGGALLPYPTMRTLEPALLTAGALACGFAVSQQTQRRDLEAMTRRVTDAQKANDKARQGDIKYDITWDTLDQYLRTLERKGVALNVASFIGAGTARTYVLGEGDVQPTPAQLAAMRKLVHEAMQDGAMGVGSALIYAPSTFASCGRIRALSSRWPSRWRAISCCRAGWSGRCAC